jgi:glyoxylase-like metal-dependent hydrolase (beta-lactamase superfamily II)
MATAGSSASSSSRSTCRSEVVGPPPASWAVDASGASAREVADGLWRLRLPTPWPQISHANAYAIDGAGGGIVLVDAGCGGHASGLEAVEKALAECGRGLDEVSDLVITHLHSDHFGSGSSIAERTGCRIWASTQDEHFLGAWRDPQRHRTARERLARRLGVPEAVVPEMADVREETDGIDGDIVTDEPLGPGTKVPTALGDWDVIETPGHAPSQVCLHLPGHGLLIVGDVVGPVLAPFFDLGFSPDPVGEHLASLRRLQALDPQLILPGHGRPLGEPRALLQANLDGIEERVARLESEIREAPGTGWELFVRVHGGSLDPSTRVWRLWESAAYLDHLVCTGWVVEQQTGAGASRFEAAQRRGRVSGA